MYKADTHLYQWSQKPLPTYIIFSVAACVLNLLYHVFIREKILTEIFTSASIEALLLILVFYFSRTFHPVKTTLCYLSLPYFLFFSGWLNTLTCITLISLFSCAFLTVLRNNNSLDIQVNPVTWQEILSFLCIILWVNLSGIGAYGYQNADHGMHNGRLKDLIDYPWPVQYSENKNLVFYLAYYIPAAALGKIFGHNFATQAMLIWSTLGVTLALRWFSLLIKKPLSPLLVLAFIFFGPQDILGFIIRGLNDGFLLKNISDWPYWGHTDFMDFWAAGSIQFFIGNFLSNTFQLFWSPHQIIAGWLGAAFLLHSLNSRDNRILVFFYALLCLWSPMIMLAFFPCVLAVFFINLRISEVNLSLSLPNLFAILLLTPLFLLYYSSGSALHNPYQFIIHSLPQEKLIWLIPFHLFTWGLYTLACTPYIRQLSHHKRLFFLALLANYILLSQLKYGAFSDMLCRGAAPLNFCLLVIVGWAWEHYRQQRRRALQCFIAICFLAGTGSALLLNKAAIKYYGNLADTIRGDQSHDSHEYLGNDDAFFVRYLRK